MKKVIYLLLIAFTPLVIKAQNVGIGINTPVQKLHINGGNLLISQPLIQTNTLPTGAQTSTMVNALVSTYLASDSTGKVFDPGGSAGNYTPNLSAYVMVPPAINCVGFEVTINSIGLGNGDSLIISDLPNWQNVHFAVGNNYFTAGSHVFNTSRLYFTFKSNSDGIVGSGFEIVFKRKFDAVPGIPVNNLAGNVFLYDAKNGSLQIGGYKNGFLGNYSISAGTSKAYSIFSTAIGINNEVYGEGSTVFGSSNKIYTNTSLAAGFRNEAYGNNMIFMFGRENYWSTSSSTTPVFIIGEKNNDNTTWGDPLFIVGNGNGPGGRGNAFEIDKTGKTVINGFTQLGKFAEGAPSIKTKKIVGYNMPTIDNSWTFIPAGLTDMNKILSLQVIVTNGIYQMAPNASNPGWYFRINTDGPNIAVGTFGGQSVNTYGMPIKVFITYEE